LNNHKLGRSVAEFAVVIPTKSRPMEIEGLLRHLNYSSPRPSLVVVVDSSTDSRTEKVCRDSSLFKDGTLKLLRSSPGAGLQRNLGVSEVARRGFGLVALIDDDVLPGSQFFGYCIDLHLELGELSVVGGWDSACTPVRASRIRHILGFGGRQMGFCLTRAGHAVYGDGRSSSRQIVDWLPGGMMFGPTQAFVENEYRSDFLIYGDDIDVSLRLRMAGYQLATSDKLHVVHLASQIGKEIDWRNHLGYFRFRFWLTSHPGSRVGAALVLINTLVSILYFTIKGLLGDFPSFARVGGDIVGVGEVLVGHSSPTGLPERPKSVSQ